MTTQEQQAIQSTNGNAEVATVEHTRGGRYYRPNVDIVERPDELLVLADMPGVTAGEVDIQFEKGVLTIEGRATHRQQRDAQYLGREYGHGDFYRSFQVSDQVDAGQITAEMSGGVLTLRLPKAATARPRKIEVKSS